MSKLEIVFNKEYPMCLQIYDAETGKPFLGVSAFHLIATVRGMEAKIITDNEVLVSEDVTVDGKCTVPVTEQLALSHSDEFMSLLGKMVAEQLTKELTKTMAYHEDFETKLGFWVEEWQAKEEAFISHVAQRLKEREEKAHA